MLKSVKVFEALIEDSESRANDGVYFPSSDCPGKAQPRCPIGAVADHIFRFKALPIAQRELAQILLCGRIVRKRVEDECAIEIRIGFLRETNITNKAAEPEIVLNEVDPREVLQFIMRFVSVESAVAVATAGERAKDL